MAQKLITLNVITRNGVLNLKGRTTKNQCAKPGQEVYKYRLAILFAPNTPLDKDGFIIDHQPLNDAVQKVKVGSCEQMAQWILHAVQKVLKKHKLEYYGISLCLRPDFVPEDNSAFFRQFRVIDEKYFPTIVAL